jgi:hypothetical protein
VKWSDDIVTTISKVKRVAPNEPGGVKGSGRGYNGRLTVAVTVTVTVIRDGFEVICEKARRALKCRSKAKVERM